jgi:hypothetical protein
LPITLCTTIDSVHWIVQPSVCMTTTNYHSSRLPSFYIWQFSTCHVEIKFGKFKVLPVLHVQIPIWKPRQTWVLQSYRWTYKTLFRRSEKILSLDDFRREVVRWRTHWVITKRNDLPITLCTTIDSVNPILYPSIDTILIKLFVLLTMPSKGR